MGYPMTYPRVIGRNHLQGSYSSPGGRGLIAGDLRRLEEDSLDANYGQYLADKAAVDLETLRRVLVAFFSDGGGTGWCPSGWEPPSVRQEQA